MKLKAIIFDVDGTLVETEEFHRVAFNEAFKNFDLNWSWSKKIYRELLKVAGGKERIHQYKKNMAINSHCMSDTDINKIYQEKKIIYTKILANNKIKLRPGIKILLERARSNDLKLCIATASSLESVNALSQAIWGKKIKNIFEYTVFGSDVKRKKPYPDIYKLVLKKLPVEAKSVVAIEDSRIGLLSSKAAGIYTIITPSNYTKGDNFNSADDVCQSLTRNNLPKRLHDSVFK